MVDHNSLTVDNVPMAEMNNANGSTEVFGRISSLDVSPLDYYDMLRYFNDLILREVADEIGKHADELSPFITLVTPGSDGRREKGSVMSPLEIIALANDEEFEGLDMSVVEKAVKNVIEKITSTRISKITEVKGPSSSMLLFDDKRIQPGRIADSRLIHGSTEVHRTAKVKLGNEIIAAHGGKLLDGVRNLKKDALKTAEKGTNRIGGKDAMHFDLVNGVVFYDPTANQLSFKIGPLRLVQNTLLFEEIKHTRDEKDPGFISRLAAGIVPRLKQLEQDKMLNLSKESVSQVMEHYAFFLRLYHRSEEIFRRHKEVHMQLTQDDVTEVAKRLQSLQELMKALKIQRQPR